MDCPHGIPVYEYCEACCGPAPEWRPDVSAYEHARIAALPDLEAAYLAPHEEVLQLRATGEIDRKFARKTADDVFAWKSRAEKAEAERDRLRAVLLKIAEYLPSFDYVARDEFGRCTDLPGSPYDRGKADASARLTAIARAALKGDSDE